MSGTGLNLQTSLESLYYRDVHDQLQLSILPDLLDQIAVSRKPIRIVMALCATSYQYTQPTHQFLVTEQVNKITFLYKQNKKPPNQQTTKTKQTTKPENKTN